MCLDGRDTSAGREHGKDCDAGIHNGYLVNMLPNELRLSCGLGRPHSNKTSSYREDRHAVLN
jgi:hypothetical protein